MTVTPVASPTSDTTPNVVFTVCVAETRFPSASMIEKCDVCRLSSGDM